MSAAPGTTARGRCPRCGRVVRGRADGIERRAADRRWVVLATHRADPYRRGLCVTGLDRVRVARAAA